MQINPSLIISLLCKPFFELVFINIIAFIWQTYDRPLISCIIHRALFIYYSFFYIPSLILCVRIFFRKWDNFGVSLFHDAMNVNSTYLSTSVLSSYNYYHFEKRKIQKLLNKGWKYLKTMTSNVKFAKKRISSVFEKCAKNHMQIFLSENKYKAFIFYQIIWWLYKFWYYLLHVGNMLATKAERSNQKPFSHCSKGQWDIFLIEKIGYNRKWVISNRGYYSFWVLFEVHFTK